MEDIDVEFLGSDHVLQRLVADNTCLHVAVGQIKSSDKRCALYSEIRSMGEFFPNLACVPECYGCEDSQPGMWEFRGIVGCD